MTRPCGSLADRLPYREHLARIGEFFRVDRLPEPTWPEGERPQMMHLDLFVPTLADLRIQRQRALDLGARELHDRSTDAEEPLYVFADPAGHPFCIFVAG